MKAGRFETIGGSPLIKIPAGSQLFALPDRRPVGFDRRANCFTTLPDAQAVAAFAAPGHTLTHSVSFVEHGSPKPLPLFSYGAAAFYKGNIYVAAIKVDTDRRHDSTLIDISRVRKNIKLFEKLFPGNRLISHLARCATVYGCPNAQNFFLSRYEAPLPVSPLCNASCAGCISYQAGKIGCSQPRIKFVPKPGEVAGIALHHIANVKDPIVSFGQGCEGEPLLQTKLIEESIKLIRSKTRRGIINLNTNGSKPEAVSRLFDAGLDTIRVSLNSAREDYYLKYYRPRGYSFKDVMKSIACAKSRGGFVSINYLTLPGFTDLRSEVAALERLIAKRGIDMIQWRNLNYDPVLYFKLLGIQPPDTSEFAGIAEEMAYLRRIFPKLRMGYFNPKKIARA